MTPRYFLDHHRGIAFRDAEDRWCGIQKFGDEWKWTQFIPLYEGPALVAQAVQWMANNYVIPEVEEAALRRFIDHGIVPGSFLRAVVENNLTRTFHAADVDNKNLIFCYIRWMWEKAPAECWGSVEKVRTWAAHRGLDGRAQNL